MTGKGAIASSEPLNAGLFGRYDRIANTLIDESDLLVVVGCKLGEIATKRFTVPGLGKRVIHLAIRWMLDQGITSALWGGRHPRHLDPVKEVSGWSLDAPAKAEIDRILRETITDPIGPEFMAPPARDAVM